MDWSPYSRNQVDGVIFRVLSQPLMWTMGQNCGVCLQLTGPVLQVTVKKQGRTDVKVNFTSPHIVHVPMQAYVFYYTCTHFSMEKQSSNVWL